MPDDEITVEVPIEQALNGDTREESNLTDEEIEPFLDLTRDIEQSKALREEANERLDEDDLTDADRLLWIDEAEVYTVCKSHFFDNIDGQWTGFTENPNFEELEERMHERVAEGVPCEFCKIEREKALADELADEVDVEVVFVES